MSALNSFKIKNIL